MNFTTTPRIDRDKKSHEQVLIAKQCIPCWDENNNFCFLLVFENNIQAIFNTFQHEPPSILVEALRHKYPCSDPHRNRELILPNENKCFFCEFDVLDGKIIPETFKVMGQVPKEVAKDYI